MYPEDLVGQPQLPPVTMLAGRYRISGHLLGRGALADVWAGIDEAHGRPVAIKMFRPGAQAVDEHRFAREVRTLTGLSHPQLISLYDAGNADGRAYLVMRQVCGGTLGTKIRTCGSLPAAAVRRIGGQMASALAYVHARGIVHRDVKPANILLDTSGAAVLADFGIARLTGGTQLTSTGVTVGTAAYLSPEQVRGREVGPAADVYALGLVLLEALTGRREYPGEAIEAAVARLHRGPAVPRDLPYGLSSLLIDMTLDGPTQRPSAEDVAARLGGGALGDLALISSQPQADAQPQAEVTVPLRSSPRSKPMSGNQRGMWLASAALAVVATAAAVVGLRTAGSADGTGPGSHAPAPASPSAGATGAAPQTGRVTTQTGSPSSVGPASLPQPAVSLASASGGHAPVPRHGKGHDRGHGKGAHKPPG